MRRKNLKMDAQGKIVSHYLQVKILFQWNTHLTTICKFFYKTLFQDSYIPQLPCATTSTPCDFHLRQLPHTATQEHGNSGTWQLLHTATPAGANKHNTTPTHCNPQTQQLYLYLESDRPLY